MDDITILLLIGLSPIIASILLLIARFFLGDE